MIMKGIKIIPVMHMDLNKKTIRENKRLSINISPPILNKRTGLIIQKNNVNYKLNFLESIDLLLLSATYRLSNIFLVTFLTS